MRQALAVGTSHKLGSTLDPLVDELAEALEGLLESSGCPDMAPLWWHSTREARAEWLPAPASEPLLLSPRLRAMGKSSRSKYRVLAAWRFDVILERLAPEDERQATAVRAIYFTPYDRNAPPYAWSSRVGSSPGGFGTPTRLKMLTTAGCWDLVRQLRSRVEDLREQLDRATFCRAEIIEAGLRDTLKDVLKLETRWESWNSEDEGDA